MAVALASMVEEDGLISLLVPFLWNTIRAEAILGLLGSFKLCAQKKWCAG
jgi:hypothetical protein